MPVKFDVEQTHKQPGLMPPSDDPKPKSPVSAVRAVSDLLPPFWQRVSQG